MDRARASPDQIVVDRVGSDGVGTAERDAVGRRRWVGQDVVPDLVVVRGVALPLYEQSAVGTASARVVHNPRVVQGGRLAPVVDVDAVAEVVVPHHVVGGDDARAVLE